VQITQRDELQEKLRLLEIVPLIQRGDQWAMDLDAIVRRHPAVCLVDELAYSNPPGSLFGQRWQEVAYLLDQGINVVTAVNLQHISEQQDRIEEITGKRSSVSFPEAFLRAADEIVVVDVCADDLAGVADGAGDPRQERARKLSELRELALILAADVVENQLQTYMERHGIHQTWGTQERILVCITPRSNAREMIESGRRNAERSHGQLFALYVEQQNLSREAEEVLEANMDLARRLGAEAHTVAGQDPVTAILDFARAQRVTQIFIGHSQRSRFLPWVRNPVDRLIEAAEGMDVRVFPQH
jgi:two-component system sensor histidine kinase KdpD